MDGSRFDSRIRSLTKVRSRRSALATVLGSALGLRGLAEAEAKTQKKKACPPCKTRKKGKCKGVLPNGAVCAGGTCQSGICMATAAPPVPPPVAPLPRSTCTDGVRNGDETDIDCGGSCARCVNGRRCAVSNDCASGLCSNQTCQECTPGPSCGPGCFCAEARAGGLVCVSDNLLSLDSVACADCPAGIIFCSPDGLPMFCGFHCGA